MQSLRARVNELETKDTGASEEAHEEEAEDEPRSEEGYEGQRSDYSFASLTP